jgi:acyl carrier protein phosphodiesterase
VNERLEKEMKYTPATLKNIESILHDDGYVIRYERGTFQSGWCLMEARKIVVLNKFLDTEGRINTLIDLLSGLTINYDALTHDSQKVYDEVIKQAALRVAS